MTQATRQIKALILVALFGASVTTAHAKAPVWEVTRVQENNVEHAGKLYLAGTIHVLAETDYPLPGAFSQAYSKADTLVFETDTRSLNSPLWQLKFLEAMTWRDETKLSDVLGEQARLQLHDFLRSRQIPLDTFERFTPMGLGLSLTTLELQRLGINPQLGVEAMFTEQADRDAKPIEWLESLEEQLQFVTAMGSLDADVMVQSTLDDLEDLQITWGELVGAWRLGNLADLEAQMLTELAADYPNLAKLLLFDRNARWMERIPEMLNDPDVEFVMVGALHLVGEQGLIRQLRALGLQVKQLD